jgi:predicted RNA binding protein with dsRBD fold (UPF0201 family)
MTGAMPGFTSLDTDDRSNGSAIRVHREASGAPHMAIYDWLIPAASEGIILPGKKRLALHPAFWRRAGK